MELSNIAAVAAFFMWIFGYAYIVIHMGEIRDLIQKMSSQNNRKTYF